MAAISAEMKYLESGENNGEMAYRKKRRNGNNGSENGISQHQAKIGLSMARK
jgi:hypothetical protein